MSNIDLQKEVNILRDYIFAYMGYTKKKSIKRQEVFNLLNQLSYVQKLVK
jgi:hypothetical protein